MAEYVTIAGMDELRRALMRTIPAEFHDKAVQLAMSRSLKHMVEAAQAKAPRGDTGILKTSIHSEKDRTNSTGSFFSRVVRPRSRRGGKKANATNARRGTKKAPRNRGSGAPYWWHVEFGHKDRAGGWVSAQPYLRPAFEQTKRKVADETIRELKIILVEAVKKARWEKPKGFTGRDFQSIRRGFTRDPTGGLL